MSHAPSRQDGLGKNSRSKVQNITGEQVQRLIAKLDVISKFLPKVPFQEILTSQDYIIGEANVDNQGEEGGKHVLQEVSIIGHLRRINALNSETTRAIELGAGTARLSDRLQRSTNATLDHIMIDRQNFAQNHCRDRHLLARSEKKVIEQAREEKTREEKAPVIERVIVDIGSLQLDHYFDNCDDGQVGKKTLCMSKHLCGPACDLTLHALSSFSGREFWESTGLSEEDFVVATAVSQWASLQEKKNKSAKRRKAEKGDTTAGTKDSRNIPQQHATSLSDSEASTLPDLFSVASLAKKNLEKAMEDLEKDFIPSQEFERHFTREEKSLLGIRIKQLFDLSRAAFCQQQLGYKSAELVIYTTRSTENRLLVLH